MTICSLHCSNAYRSELAAWSHYWPESKHPGGQRPGPESLPAKPAGPQARFSFQQNCPFLLEVQLNWAVLSSRDQRSVLRTRLDHFCHVASSGHSGWGETCRAHRVAGNQVQKGHWVATLPVFVAGSNKGLHSARFSPFRVFFIVL